MTEAGADDDPAYAVIARSDLLPRLAEEAFGAEYPRELRPYGFTTWSLLREIGQRLGIRTGRTLLDLGTGDGSIGLWLAQEYGARLIALDFSAEALRAVRRGVREPGQATFTDTGLAAGSVDAAVCLDALRYCSDQPGALRELRRVLRPGGLFALSALETVADAVPDEDATDYRRLVTDAGLLVLHHAEVSGWREPIRRNFELWVANADRLRAELGPAVATRLLDEAAGVLARFAEHRYVLVVGARP